MLGRTCERFGLSPADQIGIDREIDSTVAWDFDNAVNTRLVFSDIDIRERAERDASDKQAETAKRGGRETEIEDLQDVLAKAKRAGKR